MDLEKFENIDILIDILNNYKLDIDIIKEKLENLIEVKDNLLKNKQIYDYGLVISNFELKREVLTNDLMTKNKFLEIVINRLYLDLCYIQSLCIHVENILFELNILVEKKLDKNIFKIKNIKITDFKDILEGIKHSYNTIENYLIKFEKKIGEIDSIINSQVRTTKYSYSFFIQYQKLLLEKDKILNLINNTINYYKNVSNEYLKAYGKSRYEIFLTEVFDSGSKVKHIDENIKDLASPNHYEEIILNNIDKNIFVESQTKQKNSVLGVNGISFELSTSPDDLNTFEDHNEESIKETNKEISKTNNNTKVLEKKITEKLKVISKNKKK
jgi:hypothetical protein